MRDTIVRIGTGLVAALSLGYVLLCLATPPTEPVTLSVEFPPKDQSRLAPPPIIRKDVSHSWQTWKVAL